MFVLCTQLKFCESAFNIVGPDMRQFPAEFKAYLLIVIVRVVGKFH